MKSKCALIRLGLALAGIALAACVQTGGEDEGGPAPLAPPARWTQAFLAPAVLVADEVIVEGPEDLLEHLVLRQDPEHLEYVAKTTNDGLLQELFPKPGVSGIEIRGQIDALELVALRRMRVLQRPGEVPVTIRAVGNAYWARSDGSEERREAALELVGYRTR